MNDNIKVYGSDEQLNALKNSENCVFLCVLSNSEISKIPKLTGAGGPEVNTYTPALDVEVILRDEPLSLPNIASTQEEVISAPSPAILTKASIDLTGMPFIPVGAGLKIEPKLGYIDLHGDVGGDIREGVGVTNARQLLENAKEIGKTISKITDHIMIGESTPAGTTTTQAVLTLLGYDVRNKVSGCLTVNPQELKNQVVDEMLEATGESQGSLKDDPIRALEIAGDPTMIAIAGILMGSSVPVTLAGGTQMAAPCGIIKALDEEFDFSNVSIATTSYVADDETANILDIFDQICDVPIYTSDPQFEDSCEVGLVNYTKGCIKEGVGAGGAILYAFLKGVSCEDYKKKAEELTHANFE